MTQQPAMGQVGLGDVEADIQPHLSTDEHAPS